jgi:hypothetical protein
MIRSAKIIRIFFFAAACGLPETNLSRVIGLMPLKGLYPATAGLRARGNLSYVPKTPMG